MFSVDGSSILTWMKKKSDLKRELHSFLTLTLISDFDTHF